MTTTLETPLPCPCPVEEVKALNELPCPCPTEETVVVQCPCPIENVTATHCPIEEATITIPCPCPIEAAAVGKWGFKEPVPTTVLNIGDRFYSPGKNAIYKVVGYPACGLYWDFKGLLGKKETEVDPDEETPVNFEPIDTEERKFWKYLFLLLLEITIWGKWALPIWLVIGLTCRASPHLDNNAWDYEPGGKAKRASKGSYLSYEVTVEYKTFTREPGEDGHVVVNDVWESSPNSISITVRWNPVLVEN